MVVRVTETPQSGVGKETRFARLARRLRNFASAEGGAAAVYFMLSAPVWIAGIGLGTEVGSWYYFKQHLQGTADTVADSLAGRVGTGASESELLNIANYLLEQNEFNFAKGSVSGIEISSSGPVFVDGTTVSITLTRTVQRYLTGFFVPGSFELRATATAQVRRATLGCVLALARAGNGRFSLQAPANVQVNGCEVLTNSLSAGAFGVPAGTSLTTDCARSAGRFNILGQLTVSCREGQPEPEAGFALDPHVNLPEPDLSNAPCNNHSDLRWTETGPPPNSDSLPDGRKYVRFCNATLTVERATMTPQPYLYIFDNAILRIEGRNVTSTAASFYFVNGGLLEILAPSSRIQFIAPNNGPYGGILFFGSRTNTAPLLVNSIRVGPNSSFMGAIYFPASNVRYRFQATGRLGGCTHIIADQVQLEGSWQAAPPCASVTAVIPPIVASRNVKLIE